MDRCRKTPATPCRRSAGSSSRSATSRHSQAATPEEEAPPGGHRARPARGQGFDGVQGVGGFVDLAVDGYECVPPHGDLRPEALKPARPVREMSMKMLVLLEPCQEFEPPAWVPRDMRHLHGPLRDLLNAFDNFGPLFDQMAGEGEKGVWDDVLESLADAGGRAADRSPRRSVPVPRPAGDVLSDYEPPITPTSERLLFAIDNRTTTPWRRPSKDVQGRSNEESPAAGVPGARDLGDGPAAEGGGGRQLRTDVGTHPAAGVPSSAEEETAMDELAERGCCPTWPWPWPMGIDHRLALRFPDPRCSTSRQSATRSAGLDFRIVDATMKLGCRRRTALRLLPDRRGVPPHLRADSPGQDARERDDAGPALNNLLGPEQKARTRSRRSTAASPPTSISSAATSAPPACSPSAEADGWFFKGFTLPKQQ